jgi:hypothetical protein
MMTFEEAARSPTVLHHFAPFSTKAFVLSLERLYTLIGYPAASRCPAILEPIIPSPINPIVGFVFESKLIPYISTLIAIYTNSNQYPRIKVGLLAS